MIEESTIRDVAKLRQVEQERDDLLQREQAARREAENALQMRDTLLAVIVHDLRNPLTAVRGSTQILKRHVTRSDPPDTAKLLEGLARIDAAANRIGTLLDELADVVHGHEGQSLTLNLSLVDLVTVVQAVIAEQPSAQNGRIAFQSPLSELSAAVDKSRMARVVANLLSNAIKYSPSGSPITVKLEQVGDAAQPVAVLSVQDHGSGIPEADLPHVFERFYRGSNTPEHVKSLGIGLTDVRQIVEGHGGTVTVQSQEGVGSTFTVQVPIQRHA